jgi:hypothetical protein
LSCRYTEDATAAGRALVFSWGSQQTKAQLRGSLLESASAAANSSRESEEGPEAGACDGGEEEGDVWLELQASKYKLDKGPLLPGCECSTCKKHTRFVYQASPTHFPRLQLPSDSKFCSPG